MARNKIVDTFVKLVSIPSPSGQERAVAEYIKRYLANSGIRSHFDNTGRLNDSDSGNLVARLDGENASIVFIAHIDTVEDGDEPIRPVVRDGTVTSDGRTVLGVDNKAAVASLMEAIKEIKRMKKHPTVTAVFSTREENGVMGVEYLKLDKERDIVFVIDAALTSGAFVNKALGQIPFTIEIYGKEAHAALDPERGINAVRAAALVVSRLRLGKATDGSTLNIGKIRGGSVVNVVPKKAVISGEVRAYSYAGMHSKLAAVENVVRAVCKKTGCSYKLNRRIKEGAPPFSVHPNKGIVALAKSASESAGLKFNLMSLSASGEANVLDSRGFAVLELCRGGKAPHSVNESVTEAELVTLKEVIVEIAKNANAILRPSSS